MISWFRDRAYKISESDRPLIGCGCSAKSTVGLNHTHDQKKLSNTTILCTYCISNVPVQGNKTAVHKVIPYDTNDMSPKLGNA